MFFFSFFLYCAFREVYETSFSWSANDRWDLDNLDLSIGSLFQPFPSWFISKNYFKKRRKKKTLIIMMNHDNIPVGIGISGFVKIICSVGLVYLKVTRYHYAHLIIYICAWWKIPLILWWISFFFSQIDGSGTRYHYLAFTTFTPVLHEAFNYVLKSIRSMTIRSNPSPETNIQFDQLLIKL